MVCAACGRENPAGFGFCGSCGAPLAELEPARETRKVVTILFCDLTGSTALGDVTDPETLRATMRGYYDEMRTILERHGGTVEKFIGDAVMAVFGVPVAHEDDALRAVRAAWEMRAAVPALGLTARIGVNTGEVVAGEGDALVTGDAVNVAARLEQAAEAGDVLIGPVTRRLVRGAVQVEPLEVSAKGKPAPVQAFRLLHVDPDAAAIARRLDTPLIGRREELEQLGQAFDRSVREGRCHLFTVLGPAGVGKSRFVAEFLASVDAQVLSGRCLDYGEGITYWPVISILKQAGARADETVERVVQGGTLPNEVPWAVRSLLEEVASEQPLVVVFDDIQWGEPTFLDLVDHIADMSRGAPILLLCIGRPELLDKRPGWGGGKLNATTILLQPLSAEECAELITAHGGVDPGLQQRILDAADGNPLFVEEMVALVQEDGDVRVPSTVQALLQARIDQLGAPERAVMERGAVEGQVFHRGAVAELARPAEVDPQLVGLVRKELIHPAPATLAGDQAYRFRHLLIRDAAYDSLPKETRAVLHERFGDWLAVNAPALIELDEVVGYHLEQAARYHEELGHARPDLAERAGERLSDAGRRAAERGDTPAALKLLRRAVELLPEQTPLWERTVLDRLNILASVGGAERREAVESLERSGDPRLRMHGRVAELYDAIQTSPAEAVERMPKLAREAEELFTRAGDERGLASVWELRAVVAWLGSRAGDTLAAAERRAAHAERGGALEFREGGGVEAFGPLFHGPFTPEEIREHFAKVPPEHHVHLVVASHLAQLQGRYDEAIESTRRVEAIFTEFGLSVMITAPLTARALTLRAAGRFEEAREVFEAAIEHERALGLTGFLSTTLIDYGSTLYALGEVDDAERLAVEGEQIGGPEDVINFAQGHALRAQIAADRGDDAAAEELARSALEHAYRTDFPATQIVGHEALGHVHRAAGRTAEARAEYERALAVAERYGHAARAERLRGLLVEL